MQTNGTIKSKVTAWQVAMLFLCIFVLAALFAETAFHLPTEVAALLNRVDNLVCLVFIGDFVYNLATARHKREYLLKWGWIDLLSSIPNVQFLRWGRFVRVVRILRILRGVRSIRLILKFLFANRAKGTLVSVAMIAFVLIVFSSIVILNCETAPNSNIKTASDALWWSFVTITTVGYGDYYPTTTAGRIVATILMTAGVGLFGTFTAYVASFFVQEEQEKEETEMKKVLSELADIRRKLDELATDKEKQR